MLKNFVPTFHVKMYLYLNLIDFPHPRTRNIQTAYTVKFDNIAAIRHTLTG